MIRISLVTISALAFAGCYPAPPRVAVPAPENRPIVVQREVIKPLPSDIAPENPPPQPGYYDEPLLIQRPPEQRAFVDAYNRVGRPHLVVFVNRTLNGQIVPVIDTRPLGDVEQHPLNTSGPVVVEKETYSGRPGDQPQHTFERPGQYDDVSAQSLDYEAVENVLTDWLAANGQVTVMSPTLARARLTKEQTDALEKGERFVLTDIAQRLDGDVLIQIQAHPTRQAGGGPGVRMLAEAINIRGGQSLGRAFVDVPAPLDKRQISTYTRFLARKLMDDLTGAWMSAPPPQPTTKP